MIARLLAGATMLIAAAVPGQAKRLAPDPVAPVSFEGRRYETVAFGKARGLGQNGGYVAAPRRRGWRHSRLFQRDFRLVREITRLGLWEYTLEMKRG